MLIIFSHKFLQKRGNQIAVPRESYVESSVFLLSCLPARPPSSARRFVHPYFSSLLYYRIPQRPRFRCSFKIHTDPFSLSFRSLRGTKNSQLPPRPRPVTRQLQGHNTSPPITSQGLTQRPPRVKFSNQSDGWSRRWAGLQGRRGWGWMGLRRAVARTRIRGERMDRGTDEEHVGLW